MTIREIKTDNRKPESQAVDENTEQLKGSEPSAENAVSDMSDEEKPCTIISEISRIDGILFPTNVWGYESYLKSAENDYDYLIAATDTACGAEDRQDEEAVAGFALLRCLDDAELIRIAVDTAYRRQGIGYRLLTALKDEAERRGIHDIILEVRESNEPAKRMYEKAGFVTEGIRKKYYSEPTEDAVIMRFKW